MSSRMRWDKRRPVYEPWYARLDRDPFGRDATNHARHGALPSPKQAKPPRPESPPIRTPVERPTVAAGALARKYALRTGDLVKAREALSGAVEATIYCDGSAAPTNPGVIGAGVVILAGGVRVELYGGGWRGSNNAAELEAAILALAVLPVDCRATVIADSTYLVNGMTNWRHGWRTRDFKKNRSDIPNADRWRQLDTLASGRSITWRWIRSHNGHPMNELADKLAALGRTGGRA